MLLYKPSFQSIARAASQHGGPEASAGRIVGTQWLCTQAVVALFIDMEVYILAVTMEVTA